MELAVVGRTCLLSCNSYISQTQVLQEFPVNHIGIQVVVLGIFPDPREVWKILRSSLNSCIGASGGPSSCMRWRQVRYDASFQKFQEHMWRKAIRRKKSNVEAKPELPISF